MGLHVIKKGLDLPITGDPDQTVDTPGGVHRVALVAEDYVGMKPTFFVQAGDAVRRGQALFEDKKRPGVLHTSPGAGTVAGVHRGARRALQTVVIDLNDREQANQPGDDDFQPFSSYTGEAPASLSLDTVEALLIESGLWTALRTRPYGRTPFPGTRPHSIFINAMDSNPLAPDMDLVASGREAELAAGVEVLSKLTEGTVYFCRKAGSKISPPAMARVSLEEFDGPHPSGLTGTHIHLIDPVAREKTVWYAGLQDVLSIGALFLTGRLNVSRIVSLAGPSVRRPRLLKTRLGAAIDELVEGELIEGEARVLSGSVLSGRSAMGVVFGYLGRFHNQISVAPEGRDRVFLGWLAPGSDKFSLVNVFTSALQRGKKKFAFNTALHGGPRAMVPIGVYEKVMPLDILPTFLLRSLIVGDVERAEQLGCLELVEEDLALCTFVCPCKFEYGPILRKNLDEIELEG
jgi:Na+-transporting NADH:ubiquinone oxidoreductase subunit A